MERVGKSAMAGLKDALEDDFPAPEPSKLLAIADRLVLPGVWRFTRLGYRNSRGRWNAVSTYQGDRHAVITGATSGIGEAASRRLAEMGAHLTLVVRNKDKADEPADAVWARVTFAGQARDNLAVATFAAALRDSGLFRRVELKSSVENNGPDPLMRSFNLICEI